MHLSRHVKPFLGKLDNHAVGGDDCAFHAAFLGQLRVLFKLHILAMHGNDRLGLEPRIYLLQLFAVRVARNVHGRVAVGDNANAARVKIVLDAVDGAFVSRNGAG